MRLGAIDLGTNTAILLLADVEQGVLRAVADFQEMPRLGQGLDRTGRFQKEAMERTLEAIDRHLERAALYKVDQLEMVGTEAVRAAQNRDELLSALAAKGLKLRIISGDDEARLSFLSVAASLPLPPGGRRSVLDIGGGSTELIVGGAQPQRWASVKIGSVRLHERFIHHDPPTAEEQQQLCLAIDSAIEELPAPEGELVALAGTATTLAALHLGLKNYDGKQVDGLRLSVDRLRDLCNRLGRLTVAERKQCPGLDPRRADVIYAGALILLRVAERAGIAEVVISDRGVRWGVLEELSQAKR